MASSHSTPLWHCRPARLEDIVAISRIDTLSFPDPWAEREYHEALTTAYSRLFIVEVVDASEVITVQGFALVSWVIDEMEILRIAIAPEARRSGLGSWLLEYLKQAIACVQGTIFLEVRAGNEAALALYHNAGFVAYRIRPDYYRDHENAVLMRWPAEC